MSNIKKELILPLPITFPRLPPNKTVHDYVISKEYLKRIEIGNLQWDKPGHAPFFHLNAGQRILAHTTEKLENRREWAKHEKIKVQQQWKHLEELEERFKGTFLKMSGFMKSNEEKRLRALQTKKINGELTVKRSEDIQVLRRKIDALNKMQKEMDETITQLAVYEKYLNQVTDIYDDFKNTDDVISRYEALVTTRHVLGKRQDENLNELESARVKTAKMIEEYRFKVLGLNNVVADLNSRYNIAFREALHWENIVLSIKSRSYEKFKELTEVKQSCWNMYLLMCKRKNEAPKIQEDDVEKQLLYIKKTLQELEFVKAVVTAESKHHNLRKQASKKRNKRWT